MPLRPPPTIERLPLVGGAPCLDFVNTTGNRSGAAPRERLRSLADVGIFARRSGLLGAAEARGLSARRTGGAPAALAELITLREALYRVLRSSLEGRGPVRADLALLDREQRAAAARRALSWSKKERTWRLETSADGLRALRDALVRSAVELLCSSELERLTQCGECDWLFLDTSKNRSRRWCKKTCGDRVKARAYYRRKRRGVGRGVRSRTFEETE